MIVKSDFIFMEFVGFGLAEMVGWIKISSYRESQKYKHCCRENQNLSGAVDDYSI
jgi:hypothetical protein